LPNPVRNEALEEEAHSLVEWLYTAPVELEPPYALDLLKSLLRDRAIKKAARELFRHGGSPPDLMARLAELQQLDQELATIGSQQDPFAHFDDEDFENDAEQTVWHIQDIMVAGAESPMLIGGKSKTSAALDLAISLAWGLPWLRRFLVTRPVKVLFFSGESGKNKIRETRRRIKRAMLAAGLTTEQLAAVRHNLRVIARAQRMTNPEQMHRFKQKFREFQPDVVFVDPAYKVLCADGAKLEEVGARLDELQQFVAPAQLVLLHHFKKGGRGRPQGRKAARPQGRRPGRTGGLHRGRICRMVPAVVTSLALRKVRARWAARHVADRGRL
jgi:hypothetical protein